MFVYLHSIPYPKEENFKTRWKHRHRRPEIKKIILPQGMFYYSVQMPLDIHNQMDDFFIVQNIRKQYQSFVFAPSNSFVQSTLPAFSPKMYPAVIFLNSIYFYMQKRLKSLKNLTIAWLDKEGLCCQNLFAFATIVKDIKVYTNHSKQYQEIAKNIFEKNGLWISIHAAENYKAQEDILIDPFEKNDCGTFGMLYTIKNHTKYIFENKLQIIDKMKMPFLESDTDIQYLSALYEICNLKVLEKGLYTDIKAIKAYKVLT